MTAFGRYFSTARRREDDGVSLPDEFIRRVLGNPKSGAVAIANAGQSAVLLEHDREDMLSEVRTERLLQLLRRCLPHVKDSRQGRGDTELERDIQAELK